MITIIDYGMGNLSSIRNMFKKAGAETVITSELAGIEKADKLLLPGVGAFDAAMGRIDAMGLRPLLNYLVKERHVPILGICLGMQLLTRASEEGNTTGFGWIAADTRRFRFDQVQPNGLKIPHMGWNVVTPVGNDRLFKQMTAEMRFYFVHSYHVVCDRAEDVLGTTTHGYEFASVVGHDNIRGAQFHPEKSHRFGMNLLRNFAEM